MNTGDRHFEPEHLARWLETTRFYLFADLESLTNSNENALPRLRRDSHGARTHFIARVRGKLLRMVKPTQARGQNALRELEHTFYSQIAFIALNPAVPRHMLGWLRGGDSRMRRRIQKVIDLHVSRLSGLIERGIRQGAIRSDIDPRSAAMRFVDMIQSLALKTDADSRQRALWLQAATAFAHYRAEFAVSPR